MNQERLGKFTSSTIQALTTSDKRKKKKAGPGVSFYTHIEEKLFEIQAGRQLTDSNSRATSWGNYMEKYVYETRLKYSGAELQSKTFIVHPDPIFQGMYGGSPDIVGESRVGDIKCPFTLKSYLQAYSCKDITELRDKHQDGEKYFWQLVSNSILTGRPVCDLYFWIPRGYALPDQGEEEPEIFTIHERMRDSVDLSVKWVMWCDTEDLPYLLNKDTLQFKHFEFEPTELEKEFLLDRVGQAVRLLNEKLHTTDALC
jgi:hypothetical protein